MKINARLPLNRKYYIEIGLLETMEFIFDNVSISDWRNPKSIFIFMGYEDDLPMFWHRTAK